MYNEVAICDHLINLVLDPLKDFQESYVSDFLYLSNDLDSYYDFVEKFKTIYISVKEALEKDCFFVPIEFKKEVEHCLRVYLEADCDFAISETIYEDYYRRYCRCDEDVFVIFLKRLNHCLSSICHAFSFQYDFLH